MLACATRGGGRIKAGHCFHLLFFLFFFFLLLFSTPSAFFTLFFLILSSSFPTPPPSRFPPLSPPPPPPPFFPPPPPPAGDSFFEYLVKSWLQSNRTDALARRMFDEALEGAGEKLLERSRRHRLLYVAERKGFENLATMHHLACFAGGMFMLGGYWVGGLGWGFGSKLVFWLSFGSAFY